MRFAIGVANLAVRSPARGPIYIEDPEQPAEPVHSAPALRLGPVHRAGNTVVDERQRQRLLMTQSFAGSRSLDERRRRRLATESGEPGSAETTATSQPRRRRARRGKGAESSRRRRASHFPLRKLISARFWKIWGVGICVIGAGAAVLAGTWAATERPELLGPGFARYFEPSSTRAVSYFNTFLLISSAQLAFLIWWVRSRSLQDFSGKYRIWAWAGLGGFAAAASLSTGAHLAWSETVGWLWNIDFPNKQIWFWMAPALLWGLITLQFLRGEMRECRWSLSLLWLSTLSFGAIAAWQFGELPERVAALLPASRAFVETSLMTFACCTLFQSMLLHARHVIYTSVEPPAPRESRFRFFRFGRKSEDAASEGRRPRKRKKKTSTRTATRKRAESTSAASESKSAKSTTVEQAKSTQAAARPGSGSISGTGNPNPQSQKIVQQHAAHARNNQQDDDEQDETERVHGGDTVRKSGDAMRGLSKKERKRLRQMERDERRSQHAV